MRARVLLSANYKNYVDAVSGCGGIAVTEEFSGINTDYDGLILCGGGDINPVYYGEKIRGSVKIDNERDFAEIALAKAFIKAKKPVLGICRGLQLLNVVFGGSLYQDIPNAGTHSSFADYDLIHSVTASEGSIVEKLYGTRFVVNSYHHQAIRKIGEGFKITMMSDDNTVVEGMEHEVLPVLGVQWHPERMCFAKSRTDTVDGAKLIGYFLQMCSCN